MRVVEPLADERQLDLRSCENGSRGISAKDHRKAILLTEVRSTLRSLLAQPLLIYHKNYNGITMALYYAKRCFVTYLSEHKYPQAVLLRLCTYIYPYTLHIFNIYRSSAVQKDPYSTCIDYEKGT